MQVVKYFLNKDFRLILFRLAAFAMAVIVFRMTLLATHTVGLCFSQTDYDM